MLVGAIVPRPIAFVSTVSRDGINNLAPFSFFTCVSVDPPILCFAPLRTGAAGAAAPYKDTRNNIERTRGFVVNIVSEEIAEPMNRTSAALPPEVDEFVIAGLTAVPADLVPAPRVAESRVSMECRFLWLIDFSERPLGGCLILGEVLRIHVADDCIRGFRIDPDQLRAVGRMAGNTYARTDDRFELIRP